MQRGRDDVMSKLFVQRPLQQRSILTQYLGTVAVTLHRGGGCAVRGGGGDDGRA